MSTAATIRVPDGLSLRDMTEGAWWLVATTFLLWLTIVVGVIVSAATRQGWPSPR